METFITIKRGLFKKKIGLRFDMHAYFDLMELHGIDINNDAGRNPEQFMSGIIHCAAIRFNQVHNKKVWFNEQDVKDWVGKIQYEEIQQLKKVITESSQVLNEKYKTTGKEVKKK